MSTKLILLIEDNASDIETIKQALADLNANHTLQIARNGADGLAADLWREEKRFPT